MDFFFFFFKSRQFFLKNRPVTSDRRTEWLWFREFRDVGPLWIFAGPTCHPIIRDQLIGFVVSFNFFFLNYPSSLSAPQPLRFCVTSSSTTFSDKRPSLSFSGFYRFAPLGSCFVASAIKISPRLTETTIS